MNNQQGFTLIEVLLTLILLTTSCLALLKQQNVARQLLIQIELRARASQFLDQVDESLLVGLEKLPIPPPPYHFALQANPQVSYLQIRWFDSLGTIIRKEYH